MTIEYAQARARMVKEQLVSRGIHDPHVLRAMSEVPRHLFVDSDLRDDAYQDRPLPIGANQTISQPYMVALMVEAVGLKGPERVLEVGTGSGYAAAVISRLCAQVISIEALEELACKARAVLTTLGYTNVSVLVGDGTLGFKEQAPYDAIVVSAAASCIPRPLLEQLKVPGNLVFPMGEKQLQSLVRIRKDSSGIREDYFGECRFVNLRGRFGWEDED
jgi:protein-L-isoaspartate(D-aspartate) O-methyltransferase